MFHAIIFSDGTRATHCRLNYFLTIHMFHKKTTFCNITYSLITLVSFCICLSFSFLICQFSENSFLFIWFNVILILCRLRFCLMRRRRRKRRWSPWRRISTVRSRWTRWSRSSPCWWRNRAATTDSSTSPTKTITVLWAERWDAASSHVGLM